jgi:hypothetical protein
VVAKTKQSHSSLFLRELLDQQRSFPSPEEEAPSGSSSFQDALPAIYRSILGRFKELNTSFITFQGTFCLLFMLECSAIVASLCHPAVDAFWTAVCLGSMVVTIFLYCLLLFYLQARAAEQLQGLKQQIVSSCSYLLVGGESEPFFHFLIADALVRFTHYLRDLSLQFYRPPFWLTPFSRMACLAFTRIWNRSLFALSTILLEEAIVQHLLQIQKTPTDLEVHASLGLNYTSFACLYQRVSQGRSKKELGRVYEDRFRRYMAIAIEEFKILQHYAPDDPWVHEQLALGYHDLGMEEEEIREVEHLVRLKPQDRAILFSLGQLYFQSRMNAKGLEVYEKLCKLDPLQAQQLLEYYRAGFVTENESQGSLRMSLSQQSRNR